MGSSAEWKEWEGLLHMGKQKDERGGKEKLASPLADPSPLSHVSFPSRSRGTCSGYYGYPWRLPTTLGAAGRSQMICKGKASKIGK